MKTINCIDRNGCSRIFQYRTEFDSLGKIHRFYVCTIPKQADGSYFELAVKEIPSGAVQVIMAHHHDHPEYVAKGIPDALLPIIKKELQLDVESSPQKGSSKSVFRTPQATKYWERLVNNQMATYDTDRDVYRLC